MGRQTFFKMYALNLYFYTGQFFLILNQFNSSQLGEHQKILQIKAFFIPYMCHMHERYLYEDAKLFMDDSVPME